MAPVTVEALVPILRQMEDKPAELVMALLPGLVRTMLGAFVEVTLEWDPGGDGITPYPQRGNRHARSLHQSAASMEVKSRLAVLECATVSGIKPAATRFGLDRKTIRAWRTRAREAGPAGLVPRYPTRRARRISADVVELIAHARRDLQYGACRTRIWLLRVHAVKVATTTITRICHDLGLPPVQRPKRRRAARQLKLFEKATPGESVQVDSR